MKGKIVGFSREDRTIFIKLDVEPDSIPFGAKATITTQDGGDANE